MLSIIMLSVLLNTCSADTDENATPLMEANAIVFNNNLPVDGCAEHISLIDTNGDKIKDVLPTEASNTLLKNLLNTEIAKLPANTYTGNLKVSVVLQYKTTQEKGELICGWGSKSSVDLIEIVNITKK